VERAARNWPISPFNSASCRVNRPVLTNATIAKIGTTKVVKTPNRMANRNTAQTPVTGRLRELSQKRVETT
jgi:hypothetical protein